MPQTSRKVLEILGNPGKVPLILTFPTTEPPMLIMQLSQNYSIIQRLFPFFFLINVYKHHSHSYWPPNIDGSFTVAGYEVVAVITENVFPFPDIISQMVLVIITNGPDLG